MRISDWSSDVCSSDLGEWRVIVVDAVDDLETDGANALLKTLEEPPAKTLFLLVSHSPGRLLPTIRSRCRTLRFQPIARDAMTTWLHELRPMIEMGEVRAIVAASGGGPGQALGGKSGGEGKGGGVRGDLG